MNLKNTALSLMAAGTILLGGAAVVSAQSASSTTWGTVAVTTDGTFNAVFCDGTTIDFGSVNLNSSNPADTANGTANICYTDTQAHRGVFTTSMYAEDFTSGVDSIAATNLVPTFIHNVRQGQWSSGTGTVVGDIGGLTSTGSHVNSNPGLPWGALDLSGWRKVGFGNAGIGTGSTFYYYYGYAYDPKLDVGSVATIDLALNIPSDTVAGTYWTTFHLQVDPVTP